MVGDASDPSTFEPESFDVIMAFNVLEHCKKPWRVLANVHRWLKPGGVAIVQVPMAQTVHRTPVDCYRILPDGLAALFEDAGFSESTVSSFGNMRSCVASLQGLSTEDLPVECLLDVDERYPVITCGHARK